ncbi:hypothetical protein GCM10010522_49560 [Kribbella solani]
MDFAIRVDDPVGQDSVVFVEGAFEGRVWGGTERTEAAYPRPLSQVQRVLQRADELERTGDVGEVDHLLVVA